MATQTTLTCQRCLHTHRVESVRLRAVGDTQEEAAELRSRILASHAGELEAYEAEGPYTELEERVDTDLGSDISIETEEVPKSVVEEKEPLYTDWFAYDWQARARDTRLEEAANNVDIGGTPTVTAEELTDPFDDLGVDPQVGSLTLDSEYPADHVASLTLDGETTATGLWTTLLESSGERLLSDAISKLRAEFDRSESHEFARQLAEIGVPDSLWTAVESVVRDESKLDHLLDLTERVATQSQDICRLFGLSHLLGWQPTANGCPDTVVVRVDGEYLNKIQDGDREAETVENIARLLEHLSHSLEIVVVASPVDCRKLLHIHEHDNVNRAWTGHQTHTNVDTVAERAVVDFGSDSTQMDTLRYLARNPDRGVSYTTLADELGVTRQRLSQIIPETDASSDDRLEARDLVTTINGCGRTQVEITPYGRRAAEKLTEREREQTTLTESVSKSLQFNSHGREVPYKHEEGEKCDPRRKGTGVAQVQSLSSWRAAQPLNVRTPQGISVVDAAVETTDDCREAALWVDTDDNSVVVSCEFTNPMQWTLSTARALSNPRVLSAFITESRADVSEFGDLFADHRQLLRSSTCLGHLPDRLDDLADFAGALQEARDDLEDLSGDLVDAKAEGDDTDVDRLYGQITRDALGLSSTIVAVLDLLDVEVIREVRVPEFCREFDGDRWQDLTQMVGVASAIQSRKGLNTLYRQLFEQREEKLEWSVDLDDQSAGLGSLMGSWVICGDFGAAHSEKRAAFVDDLQKAVADPRPLREEAPEVGARIPISAFETDREAVRQAARWICQYKGYSRPSSAVVSVLQLYTGGAYDAAEALNHLQESQTATEELNVRELRHAISHLSTDRIVPTESRAVGRIVRTLLRAEDPLGTQALTDRADVARSTLTRDGGAGDRLLGLGLLERTESGNWRVPLPTDRAEECQPVLPEMLLNNATEAVRDVLGKVVFRVVANPQRLSDAEDPITSPWLYDLDSGPDCWPLLDEWDWLRPWVPTLVDVLDHDPSWWDNESGSDTVLGIEPDQTQLTGISRGIDAL